MTTITPIQVTTRVEKVMTQTDLAVVTILNLGIHTYVSFPNFIPFFKSQFPVLYPSSQYASYTSLIIPTVCTGISHMSKHFIYLLMVIATVAGSFLGPVINEIGDRFNICGCGRRRPLLFILSGLQIALTFLTIYICILFYFILLFYYFFISLFLRSFRFNVLHHFLFLPLFIYFFKLNRQLQPHLFRVLDFHASIVLTFRDLVNMVVPRP